MSYIELHAHSAYSFLDGASLPEELALREAELGYPALALTDHDGVYGSLEFAHAAKAVGVKPITGAETTLADGVQDIQRQIVAVSESVFRLEDAGRREEAYRLAERELRGRLQPALTQMNREIYRRARESSVRGAFGRLEEILADEGRTLVAIIALALIAGLVASWVISQSLARPVRQLTEAMAVVGGGDLDHPVQAMSRDEIGDVARALAVMTGQLRASRE